MRVPDERLEQRTTGLKLTPITSRGNGDDERPRVDEDVSERGVPSGWPTAIILIDVESVTSDDVF